MGGFILFQRSSQSWDLTSDLFHLTLGLFIAALMLNAPALAEPCSEFRSLTQASPLRTSSPPAAKSSSPEAPFPSSSSISHRAKTEANSPARLRTVLTQSFLKYEISVAKLHFRKMVEEAIGAAKSVLRDHGKEFLAEHRNSMDTGSHQISNLSSHVRSPASSPFPRTQALLDLGEEIRINPKDPKRSRISTDERESLEIASELERLYLKSDQSETWMETLDAVIEEMAGRLWTQAQASQLQAEVDWDTWTRSLNSKADELRTALGRTVIVPGQNLAHFEKQFLDDRWKHLNQPYQLKSSSAVEILPGVHSFRLGQLDAINDRNKSLFYLRRDLAHPHGPLYMFFHGATTYRSHLGSMGEILGVFGGGIAPDTSFFGPFPQHPEPGQVAEELISLTHYLNSRYVAALGPDGKVFRRPSVWWGRSWGATQAYLVNLQSRVKSSEVPVDMFVLQSFSHPFTLREQIRSIERQVEVGAIEGYVPEVGTYLIEISKRIGGELNELANRNDLRQFGDLLLFVQGDADADGGLSAVEDLQDFRQKYAPRSRLLLVENPILKRAAHLFGKNSPSYKKVRRALDAIDPDKVEASHYSVSSRQSIGIETLKAELLQKGLAPKLLQAMALDDSHASQMGLTTKQIKLGSFAMMDDILANSSSAPELVQAQQRLGHALAQTGFASFFEFGLSLEKLSLEQVRSADPKDLWSLPGRARKIADLREEWLRERAQEVISK